MFGLPCFPPSIEFAVSTGKYHPSLAMGVVGRDRIRMRCGLFDIRRISEEFVTVL
jgi:hypothetical protein